MNKYIMINSMRPYFKSYVSYISVLIALNIFHINANNLSENNSNQYNQENSIDINYMNKLPCKIYYYKNHKEEKHNIDINHIYKNISQYLMSCKMQEINEYEEIINIIDKNNSSNTIIIDSYSINDKIYNEIKNKQKQNPASLILFLNYKYNSFNKNFNKGDSSYEIFFTKVKMLLNKIDDFEIEQSINQNGFEILKYISKSNNIKIKVIFTHLESISHDLLCDYIDKDEDKNKFFIITNSTKAFDKCGDLLIHSRKIEFIKKIFDHYIGRNKNYIMDDDINMLVKSKVYLKINNLMKLSLQNKNYSKLMPSIRYLYLDILETIEN